jgi:uncharacterized membrane protein
MSSNLRMIGLVLWVFFVTSCASSGPHINGGALFTMVDGPVTSTNAGSDELKGSACAINVLGLVAVGDNSIETAKRSSGIKVVSSVDYNHMSVLWFFTKVCTNVKGSGRASGGSGEGSQQRKRG